MLAPLVPLPPMLAGLHAAAAELAKSSCPPFTTTDMLAEPVPLPPDAAPSRPTTPPILAPLVPLPPMLGPARAAAANSGSARAATADARVSAHVDSAARAKG